MVPGTGSPAGKPRMGAGDLWPHILWAVRTHCARGASTLPGGSCGRLPGEEILPEGFRILHIFMRESTRAKHGHGCGADHQARTEAWKGLKLSSTGSAPRSPECQAKSSGWAGKLLKKAEIIVVGDGDSCT